MSFPWPRAVSAFEDSGIWDKIESRLVGLGAEQEHIDRIRQQLLDGERAVTIAAITGGEGFRTIWEREGSDE